MIDTPLFTETDTPDKTRRGQSADILDYLRGGKRITPLDALRLFGCFRLGARIWDLKKDGHDIKSVTVKLSSGKRVAEYWLEKL